MGEYKVDLMVVISVLSMVNLNAYQNEADRSSDQFMWQGAWYGDYEQSNKDFLVRNIVDTVYYENIYCTNPEPSFMRMRNIAAACTRWIGDPIQLPWCVRLMVLSHCATVGGGLVPDKYQQGPAGVKGLLAKALASSKGPQKISEMISTIVDHDPFQKQFIERNAQSGASGKGMGLEPLFMVRDKELEVARDVACEMRRRGEFLDLLRGLMCVK